MKVSAFIAASVDGFIAKPDGDVEWLTPEGTPKDLDCGYDNFYAKIDVLILGRNSYEKCLTFSPWPYSTKKVVVLTSQPTDTLALPEKSPSSQQPMVEFYQSGTGLKNLQSLLEGLGSRGFKHAYVDGGKVIQSFIREKLLQTICITQIPVILGCGIPLFDSKSADEQPVKLKLLSTATIVPGNFLQYTYELDYTM